MNIAVVDAIGQCQFHTKVSILAVEVTELNDGASCYQSTCQSVAG